MEPYLVPCGNLSVCTKLRSSSEYRGGAGGALLQCTVSGRDRRGEGRIFLCVISDLKKRMKNHKDCWGGGGMFSCLYFLDQYIFLTSPPSSLVFFPR